MEQKNEEQRLATPGDDAQNDSSEDGSVYFAERFAGMQQTGSERLDENGIPASKRSF
jgi:hypothetical protein